MGEILFKRYIWSATPLQHPMRRNAGKSRDGVQHALQSTTQTNDSALKTHLTKHLALKRRQTARGLNAGHDSTHTVLSHRFSYVLKFSLIFQNSNSIESYRLYRL